MQYIKQYMWVLLTDNCSTIVGESLAEFNESKCVDLEWDMVCDSTKSVQLFLGGIFSLNIIITRVILIMDWSLCGLSFHHKWRLDGMGTGRPFMLKVWRQSKRWVKLRTSSSIVNVPRHSGDFVNVGCEMRGIRRR